MKKEKRGRRKNKMKKSKLVINFGNNELHIEGKISWCKKAYDKIVKSMKEPKHDVFTFTFDDKTYGECIRLSEIKFIRLLPKKKEEKEKIK